MSEHEFSWKDPRLMSEEELIEDYEKSKDIRTLNKLLRGWNEVNNLHIKPITVGELEYLYDTLHTLYRHTESNEELTLPESRQATEIYQTAANMLQKILDFEEEVEEEKITSKLIFKDDGLKLAIITPTKQLIIFTFSKTFDFTTRSFLKTIEGVTDAYFGTETLFYIKNGVALSEDFE